MVRYFKDRFGAIYKLEERQFYIYLSRDDPHWMSLNEFEFGTTKDKEEITYGEAFLELITETDDTQ